MGPALTPLALPFLLNPSFMSRETLIRFAISTAETFAATFLATFATLAQTPISTGDTYTDFLLACASGAIVAAGRTTLKAVREAVVRNLPALREALVQYLSAKIPKDGGKNG